MTELKIKIWNQKPISLERKEGAYIATCNRLDDRIIFFNEHTDTVTIIDKLVPVIFSMRKNQVEDIHTNFKKIKKMAIEVELE